MTPRETVLAVAWSRICVGAALLLLPGLFGRLWLGSKAAHPGARVALRAVGARDAALGLGVIIAEQRGRPLRGWVEAGMAVDATDAASTIVAGGGIPLLGRLMALIAALGALAAGWQALQGLDEPSREEALDLEAAFR